MSDVLTRHVIVNSSFVFKKKIKVLKQLRNRVDELIQSISHVQTRELPIELSESIRLAFREALYDRRQSYPII